MTHRSNPSDPRASRRKFIKLAGAGAIALSLAALPGCAQQPGAAPARDAADLLPSWNDTGPKRAIVGFVERVTKEGSLDFVPVPERSAVFDNDGTLGPSSRCTSRASS